METLCENAACRLDIPRVFWELPEGLVSIYPPVGLRLVYAEQRSS
jgi:hypothetical protein